MSSYAARPTYEQLRDRIAADLAAVPEVLRGPLAAAWAGACHGEHGHIAWASDQCSPLTCEEDRLQDWATLYKVDRLLATSAVGAVAFSGSVGATLLKDTTLRGPNGLNYVVLDAVTLTASTGTANVRCEDGGSAGNLSAGAALSLVDPVDGIASSATVGDAGVTGGAEEETTEDWRSRVVDEWQTITNAGAGGGRRADYVFWAKSAHPSVTGALIQFNTLGVGTVVIRPICNTLANRLPTQAVLDAVLAYLQSAAPVMPDLYVVAPSLHGVAVSVDLAAAVDTSANRAVIEAALASLVRSKQSDSGDTLLLSEIDGAVETVTSQFTRIAPTASIVCGAGEILALPVLSWV